MDHSNIKPWVIVIKKVKHQSINQSLCVQTENDKITAHQYHIIRPQITGTKESTCHFHKKMLYQGNVIVVVIIIWYFLLYQTMHSASLANKISAIKWTIRCTLVIPSLFNHDQILKSKFPKSCNLYVNFSLDILLKYSSVQKMAA